MCFSQILLGYLLEKGKPYSDLKILWNNHFWWKPTHAIVVLYKESSVEKKRYNLYYDSTNALFKLKLKKARCVKVVIRFEGAFGCARYKKLKINLLADKLQPVRDINYQIIKTYEV